MDNEKLYASLHYVNHPREKRLEMANQVIDNPHLVDPISFIACWVLEFTAKKELSYLYSHLDYFMEHIHKVYLVLEQNCKEESTAYKAKTRHILIKII